MELADKECPSPTSSNDGKKGRKKKGKERALIERLKKLKDSVCLFINDFRAHTLIGADKLCIIRRKHCIQKMVTF